MGLTPDVFDSMTPAQFVYAQIGWINKRHQDMQVQFEAARFNAYIIASIQIEPAKRVEMTKMIPLPWDTNEQEDQKEISDEERRERVNILMEAYNHGK